MDSIGKRVEYIGEKGTLRFMGELRHTPKRSMVKPKGLWAGIMWDDANRGNHNGTVESVEYFSCPGTSGSLVRSEKINFGVTLLEAFVNKYFKDNEVRELLKDRESLAEKIINLVTVMREEDKKNSEYDAEAIINTSVNYKRIEFVGWNQIWKQMRDLQRIENLSLSGQELNSFGKTGEIRALFSSIKQLSIEDNLLHSWDQVPQLIYEFPQLEILWLSNNPLKLNGELNQEKKQFCEKFPELCKEGFTSEVPM